MLLQKYEAWSDQQKNDSKEYELATHIACNGEEGIESIRPEFALFIMQEHMRKNLVWSVLVWRAWLLWWTRAEQLHRWASQHQNNATSSIRTLLHCANMNAWYKAWHWALEEQPANVGMYLEPAKKQFVQAMVFLKEEKTLLRSILQIALKEESWYATMSQTENDKVTL